MTGIQIGSFRIGTVIGVARIEIAAEVAEGIARSSRTPRLAEEAVEAEDAAAGHNENRKLYNLAQKRLHLLHQ